MSPEQLASLPLQVLLLIAIAALWRAYNAAQNARVDDLKANYEKNLADLRTRVILLEDNMGIKRPYLDDKAAVPGAKLD